MAVTQLAPGTVILSGGVLVNDLAASEAIKPGHLVDRFNSSGTIRWRKQATASIACAVAIAKEASMLGKGIDDAYALNDLMEVAILRPGDTFLGWVPSGQNLTAGQKVEANGAGDFKAFSAGIVLASLLENTGAVTVAARYRMEKV